MPIGTMRHRIALQNSTPSGDSRGGSSLSWATADTVWAEVKPLSGSEALRGMEMQDRITHRITIRFRDDITINAKSRVLWGSRIFNIRSVRNIDERGKYIVMSADEGVAV
jgi:SPP1 family predicted phage head-tail adaptor